MIGYVIGMNGAEVPVTFNAWISGLVVGWLTHRVLR